MILKQLYHNINGTEIIKNNLTNKISDLIFLNADNLVSYTYSVTPLEYRIQLLNALYSLKG